MRNSTSKENDANQIEEGMVTEYEKCASPLPALDRTSIKSVQPINRVDNGETTSSLRGASIPMLILLSLPKFAIQMAWAAQYAAFGPYLTTMLSSTAVQLTQIVGPLTGIIVAPTVGVLSDRSTNKFGRRRPWLVYGAVTSSICYFMMGYSKTIGEYMGDEEENRPWMAVWTIFFYAWMDVTVNVVQTPAILIVTDFAGDRQTTGSAIGGVWSVLGGIFIALYISLFGPAHQTLKSFLAMMAIVMIICVGVVCIFVDEKPLPADKQEEITKISASKQILDAFASIYTGLAILPQQLAVFAVLVFLTSYGYTAYNGNKSQFFGLEVYDGDADGADDCDPNCSEAQELYNKGIQFSSGYIDSIMYIVGPIILLFLPLCVRKYGAKACYTAALLPQCLLMIVAFSKNLPFNAIVIVLSALAPGVEMIVKIPILFHVLGDDADIGIYVGAMNSANCFGQLINFVVGSAIISTPLGYKLPVFLGGLFTTFAVIICFTMLKVKVHAL